MATAPVRRRAKAHPLAVTLGLSTIGYIVVLGTFLGMFPAAIYPDLSIEQVNRFADAIALVNTITTILLIGGWYWIRTGAVRKHRAAMLTAFGLIILFLVLYLTKVGGGGTKEFVGPTGPYYVYLAMLAVHILLSIISVPVVIYQVVTGLTHSPDELRRTTRHRTIGRLAAGAWIISLSLGVLAYVLLNHIYAWRFIEASIILGI